MRYSGNVAKKIPILFIPLIILLVIATPVMAVVYYSNILVQETTGTDYGTTGLIQPMDISFMASERFINSDGRDVQMMLGGAATKRMLTDDYLLFTDDVTPYQSDYYSFSTNNTAEDFSIITGTGGYVYTADSLNLEWGNDGSAELDGYYDPASSGYLLKKDAAYQAYGNGSGNVTWEISHSSTNTNTTAAIRPNAAGTHTNLTPSAGTNHACAGDNNDATYVSGLGSNVYVQDTYNIPNPTGYIEPIASVTIYFRIANSGGGGTTYAKPLLVTHAVYYEGTEQSQLGGAWSTKNQVYATNPNTGLAWTWDEINDLEIGVELKVNINYSLCADVWIIVAYHPWVGIESDVIAEGEHTFYPAYVNPFIVLGIDDTTVPVTDNLTLNLPLWQEECSTSPFNSIDSNALACTVSGATWTLGEGYYFDGINDVITVTHAAPLNITTEITLEAWVKADTLTSTGDAIFFKPNVLGLEVGSTGNVRFLLDVGGFAAHDSDAGEITTGSWYHIAATYDGANWYIYVNGIEQKTGALAGAINTSANNLKIGEESAPGWNWNGDIGECRVYSTALSAAEVLQNYNATKSLYTTADDVFVYSYAGGVTDNANDIYFCTDDIMPYYDTVEMQVSGVQQLYYAPNSIIIGTDLPDRGTDATDNAGVFVWGSNPASVSIQTGYLQFDESTVTGQVIPLQDSVDVLNAPDNMSHQDTDMTMTGNIFYFLVKWLSDITDIDVVMIWWWFSAALSIGVLVLARRFLGSIWVAGFLSAIVSGAFVAMGMTTGTAGALEFWIPVVIIIATAFVGIWLKTSEAG